VNLAGYSGAFFGKLFCEVNLVEYSGAFFGKLFAVR
jgi:hypothetical protein